MSITIDPFSLHLDVCLLIVFIRAFERKNKLHLKEKALGSSRSKKSFTSRGFRKSLNATPWFMNRLEQEQDLIL
jgi:hypothetical protein